MLDVWQDSEYANKKKKKIEALTYRKKIKLFFTRSIKFRSKVAVFNVFDFEPEMLLICT